MSNPRIYVLGGTCTAGPEDDLVAFLTGIFNGTYLRSVINRGALERVVTGGSSVSVIVTDNGCAVVDPGDLSDGDEDLYADRITQSVARDSDPLPDPKPPLRRAIDLIAEYEGGRIIGYQDWARVLTHTDHDHFGNMGYFPSASPVLYTNGDDYLSSVMPDGKGHLARKYAHRASAYQYLVDRGICRNDFFPSSDDELKEALSCDRVIQTPGHMKGHVSYLFDRADVTDLETCVRYDDTRLIIAGDAIVSQEYLERFLEGDCHSPYGTKMARAFHRFRDEKEARRMNRQSVESQRNLMEIALEDPVDSVHTLILFGHGPLYDVQELRDRGINQEQVKLIQNPFGGDMHG